MPSKPRLFISYRRKDKNIADYLHRELKRYGFNPFYDEDVRADDPSSLTINQEIEECDYFVLILSEHTFDSAIIRREIGAAKKFRKHFIVLFAPEISTRQEAFQSTLSEFIKGTPYISLPFDEGQPERSFKEILKIIHDDQPSNFRKILSPLLGRKLGLKVLPKK